MHPWLKSSSLQKRRKDDSGSGEQEQEIDNENEKDGRAGGEGGRETSSSKVCLLRKECALFLCHCFPFSWQREESQGRACQCESSLKV